MFGSQSTKSFRAPRTARRKLALSVMGGLAALAAASTAEAKDLPGIFNGDAYATVANVKAGVITTVLARSAYQDCACQGTNGQVKSNEVDGISAGPVLTANQTISSVYTIKTKSTAEVQNSTSVGGLSALGGLITADSIKSVAEVDVTKTSMTTSSTASSFGNLTVAGQVIPTSVPANTVIPIPGIGSVTLNKIVTKGNIDKAGGIDVEAISITVDTANALGIPVGANIIIGHASAGYNRKVPPAGFGGTTYAALASGSLSDDLKNKIGQASFLALGCEGTHGKTEHSKVTRINVSGLMTLADGGTTAFAGTEGDRQVARTTATFSRLNLLGGVIQVDALQAVAASSVKDGKSTGSADGSGFSGLTIAGVGIPANLPPNSNLPLPLLGNVTVNEQTVNDDGSVVVNGLHIKITTVNLLGLPVGAEFVVAHAGASAAPL